MIFGVCEILVGGFLFTTVALTLIIGLMIL